MGKVAAGVAAAVAAAACAVAGVVVGRRVRSRRKWKRVVGVLRELEEACETPVGRLRQVVDAMAVEMHAGLASEGGSKLKMLLTFVDHLPTGSEIGTYYALDLGGTNFRVLRVQLGGRRSSILSQDVERRPIPRHLMTSTSEDLFDFIASTLKQFVEKEESGSEPSSVRARELGLTFSFPVKQLSIRSGILIKWTKGFAIEDMVGEEVVGLLEAALIRSGLDMRVAVLVNDTAGTLALGHYDDADTVAAVIIGTGTNACYLERADAIIKCQGLLTTSGCMVVNMEWGNFWSSHLPRTSYDIDLDLESPNPNDQGFEKLISGMYLGDIVRRVILRMSQDSDIFGPVSSRLSIPFILQTPLLAAMHEDDSPELKEVDKILKETLEISEVSLKVRKLVVRICDVVTRRAARLAAAGIVGILKKIGRDGSGGITGGRSRSDVKMRRTVVAIEGGLYTSYTMFREYLHEALNEILGEDVAQHVILEVTEDGMGEEMEQKEEGVMATDFFWSYTDEPHASRRRQILSQYPQIKELFGPDPWAFFKITVVVSLQLWTATLLHDAGWLKMLAIAYFFGSFLNHNLFLAIHELSHNLAFSTPVYNRCLGIFANLPVGVPMSVTFQKYHLEHHRFQGVDGIDMDIPSRAETLLVTNVVAKSIWVMLQLFFYALRPLFIKPKPPGYWEFINFSIQIALDAAVVYFWGWRSLAYLILSTFVGGGMHPMAGHFISEHYVFKPEQETYSYYGPLNLLTWHVGYHNEHHDFPRIPGSKLHKVKDIAPEYYEGLESYKSWSQVIYMYLMDRTVGPFSRMKRKAPGTAKKSE